MKKLSLFLLSIAVFKISISQPDRWQQRIKYNIDVQMDVAKNQFKGKEKMEYTNNSPDSLNKLFIHLYWNAFQPNSSMDVRSRELGKTRLDTPSKRSDGLDWDARVKDRISKLQANEIGYQKVLQVLVNGKKQSTLEHETILEVVLDKPIAPKSKTIIDIDFEAQVPKQIRRSGRDNAEGIQYSMSQWYPKMVEYDYQGWNA
ncbi:MAG: M1 family peptidase, partial [Chitinophagaceae bacterium]